MYFLSPDYICGWIYPPKIRQRESKQAVFYLDHNYLENMCAMFRKVNTKERIVGFYSTGPQIRPNDLRIHDIVQRYCKSSPNSTITTPSVFCIIDVRPDRPDLPVTSYKVVEEVSTSTSSKSNGQRQVQRSFTHVPSLMGAMEAEEIGVEHLLRDINDPTVSTVAALIRGKTAGLATLTEKLVECKDYLQGVAASPKQANPEILANLQKILNLLPNLNQHDMIRSLAIKTNDMMMAIYLAALIRSVIALHDVVNNKIRYGEDGTERPVPETSKSEEKKDDASDKENKKKSGSKQNSDGTAGETKEKK